MLKAVDFKQVQQFNNKWEILHSSCKRFIADWNKIRLQSKKDLCAFSKVPEWMLYTSFQNNTYSNVGMFLVKLWNILARDSKFHTTFNKNSKI